MLRGRCLLWRKSWSNQLRVKTCKWRQGGQVCIFPNAAICNSNFNTKSTQSNDIITSENCHIIQNVWKERNRNIHTSTQFSSKYCEFSNPLFIWFYCTTFFRKKLIDEVLVWLSVWSKVQIGCIWSSWCHCYLKTQKSLASFKSRPVLPFWYRLTQVPDPGKEAVKRV